MYCDAHIHLLPRMDNGALDVSESLAMALKMIEHGTRQAIVAPHYDSERESVADFLARRTRSLRTLTHANRRLFTSRLRLVCSAEVEVVPRFAHVPGLERLMIPHTSLLPVALPLGCFNKETEKEFAFLMHKRKIYPMICHLERYIVFYNEPDYQRLTSLPYAVYCLGVNALQRKSISDAAFKLARSGKTILLCSNAHDATDRAPVSDTLLQSVFRMHGASVYKTLALQTTAFLHDAFH